MMDIKKAVLDDLISALEKMGYKAMPMEKEMEDHKEPMMEMDEKEKMED